MDAGALRGSRAGVAAVAAFIGRRAEMEHWPILLERPRTDYRIALYGHPRVGKTTL